LKLQPYGSVLIRYYCY